ncbi:hypothetical protein DFH27DRAFT_609474 [Peziza echinospora]|nr:hypothetical protein DFH27DRAFT_609474 [Peziza echinospora]
MPYSHTMSGVVAMGSMVCVYNCRRMLYHHGSGIRQVSAWRMVYGDCLGHRLNFDLAMVMVVKLLMLVWVMMCMVTVVGVVVRFPSWLRKFPRVVNKGGEHGKISQMSTKASLVPRAPGGLYALCLKSNDANKANEHLPKLGDWVYPTPGGWVDDSWACVGDMGSGKWTMELKSGSGGVPLVVWVTSRKAQVSSPFKGVRQSRRETDLGA